MKKIIDSECDSNLEPCFILLLGIYLDVSFIILSIKIRKFVYIRPYENLHIQ
jgi:hypothetical protein